MTVPSTHGASFRALRLVIPFISRSGDVATAEGDGRAGERDRAPGGRTHGAPLERTVEAVLTEEAVPGLERRGQQKRAEGLDTAESAAELHHHPDHDGGGDGEGGVAAQHREEDREAGESE